MRAAFVTETGPVESIQIGDIPQPSPKPGEVLVKVHAVSYNPIDLYVRSGVVAMPMAFPYIIGSDVAGVVEAIGVGSSRFQVGDRVWGSGNGLMGRQGCTAEFAAIPEDYLYKTPENVPDADAAAMALTGITAYLGLFQFGLLGEGETVYVPGGTGGVGSMVVQMAKAAGAKVVTSAGSDEKVKLCRKLGADLALNYRTDDIPAQIREFTPEGLDIWYETQREPDLELSIPLLRKRGRMILMAGRTAKPVLPLGSFYPRNCSLLGFAMFNATPAEQRVAADRINQWTSEGKLKALIGKTFSFDQVVAAQQLLEQNTIGGAGTLHGKVVVTLH